MRKHPDLASTVLAAAVLAPAILLSPWALRAHDGAESRSGMLAAADSAQRHEGCATSPHEPCGTREPADEHLEKTTLSGLNRIER